MSVRGALMVCGTASDVGKSRIVAGLCRALVRAGLRVAPFKAQNMALNSMVTASGHEIARSQAHQAAAARIDPEVEMNPVLLKPTGEMTSQLVVMGRAAGEVRAADYGASTRSLSEIVAAALSSLRARYDVVVAEGAGGAAEINLLHRDIVNLPLARRAGIPAILVGDIERGGVFASIYGTVALLPEELRAQLGGFVVNKLRGDPHLLDSGIAEIERRCGLPCLGVIPHLGLLTIDAEDSLALGTGRAAAAPRPGSDALDVAVVHLPHLANFTDLDPLAIEPGVAVRFVSSAATLGDPDLVVLPGSKATVADLRWLREHGVDRAIGAALRRDSTLLGICAGYQMLGATIDDDVESGAGKVAGLGLLDVHTVFERDKCTRQRRGRCPSGVPVDGYEIHHGRPLRGPGSRSWLALEDGSDVEHEGVADPARGIWATSLHGVLEADAFRRAFLSSVATRRAKQIDASSLSFESCRQAEIDLVANAIETHIDLDAVRALIDAGAPR
ncbi:MAG TPA: cobyric acid synthase [Acidimicrobiales bacterium]|nr:cobyric acid synthase [Acidimicrobiales bacterium]